MTRFTLLSTFFSAVVLWLAGNLLVRQMERGLRSLHEKEAIELQEMLRDGLQLTPEFIRERIGRDTETDAAMYFVQLHDEQGRVLFRSTNLGGAVLPLRSELSQAHEPVTIPGVGRVILSSFDDGALHLQIASSTRMIGQLLDDYWHLAWLLVAGTAVVSLGVGYAFGRVTFEPLRVMAATASRIRGDNLRERIPLAGARDELGDLARLLNEMFDRLENAFSQVQRFSADVSHELKTPLALMRLSTERLAQRLGEDPEAGQTLAELREEVDRMNAVIDRLLLLARAESGELRLPLKDYPAPTLLNEWAEDAALLAEDRGVHLRVEVSEEARVWIEPVLCRQVFFNLIDNALRVSPRGSTLRVTGQGEGKFWALSVIDEGPGVPTEQLDLIFRRFVRLEPGSGATRGSGLGLAIARSVLVLLGGRIEARNRTDRTGLIVTLYFPRSEQGRLGESSESL